MEQKVNTHLIPSINVQLYCLLFKIENTLRELIIESLSLLDGPRWYKSRLPEDILDRYKSSLVFERSIRWTKMIPHHPIYYIDFADLRKIIERNDNWDNAFKNIFVRKEVITAFFAELEPIRNKIAHNRKGSESDFHIVKGALSMLLEAIGDDKINQLLSKCTQVLDIKNTLIAFNDQINNIILQIKQYQIIEDVAFYKKLKSNWWFDDSYLNYNLENITLFMKKTSEYISLKRGRGVGHIIEKWVIDSNIGDYYEKAHIDLNNLLKEGF